MTLAQHIFAAGVDGCVINLCVDSWESLVTTYLKLPESFAGIQNSFLARADSALYAAKINGRNRVEIA